MKTRGRTAALLSAAIALCLVSAAAQAPSTPPDDGALETLLRQRVSTGTFARLYSMTFYDLIGRIEDDGFLRESDDPVHGYDGMYPRTVGATVSLLLAVDRPEPAERLIRCVLNAMTYNGMERVPHAFDKERTGSPAVADRYIILGRGDQLDGQAHVIMAWARLANYRGRTPFEDSTWPAVSALLNASVRPPYCRDTTNGKIPDLMFNPYFEHSRPASVKWRYDLLTQFFVGAALSEMITVAERRHDSALVRSWKDRLQKLQAAIARHFIVHRGGKEMFAELLLADSNKVFGGMGWVNLAPVAAGWNPFNAGVMRNTVDYMYARLARRWDGLTWLPTDSWPDGEFSPQIIGKGLGWELEFASRERRYRKVAEIIDLVEYLHHAAPVYMENASLYNRGMKRVPLMTADSLSGCRACSWKLADPGNGEQVSWWCWAVANLRKRLGLDPVPERVPPDTARRYAGSVDRPPRPAMQYEQVPGGPTVSLLTEPSPKYAARGAATLVDGTRGTMDLSENQWLGFQGSDFEAVFDFGKTRHITAVSGRFMHNPDSWIFLPKKVRLFVSEDGQDYREIVTLDLAPHAVEEPEIRNAALLSSAIDCRFLKIRAENFGVCPPWHKAAGRNAWLFVDEIEIR